MHMVDFQNVSGFKPHWIIKCMRQNQTDKSVSQISLHAFTWSSNLRCKVKQYMYMIKNNNNILGTNDSVKV